MPPKKAPATKMAAKPATKPGGGAKSTGAAKGAGGAKAKPAQAAAPRAPPLPEETMEAKKILPFLTHDKDEIIKKSQRWPYIVDENGVVARLLQYSDINLLDVGQSEQMEPERIRMALLGSLRYGKPLVFDMREFDMFSAIDQFLNRVLPDLTDLLMTKKVMDEKCIDQIIKPTDEQDYSNSMLYKTDSFRFGLITTKTEVSDEIRSKMLVVRVE